MEDLLYSLVASWGGRALLLVLGGVGWLVNRFVLPKVGGSKYLARVWDEARAAALEVGQTFVDDIKAGRADGKLTEEEKRAAREKALAILKANIGAKGLKRLARILDLEDAERWLTNKLEAAVAVTKPPVPPKGAAVKVPPPLPNV